MDDKTRRELFSLIEYCRIYNHNIGDFSFGKTVESPDLQSEKLNVGIECTSATLSGVYRAMNATNFLSTADFNRKSKARDVALQSGEYKKAEQLADELARKNPVFAYATSESSSPERLLEVVRVKIEKLNGHYKHFNMNILFVKLPLEFHFTNCNNGVCKASECQKCTACDDCEYPYKYEKLTEEFVVLGNCDDNTCRTYKTCSVGAFVKLLQGTNFNNALKFNSIILSKDRAVGKEPTDEFCCWVIDTGEYTIVEHRGKRVLKENEKEIVKEAIA